MFKNPALIPFNNIIGNLFVAYSYPPFTQSCDFRTIMPIKPRSEKVLDRGGSGPIGVEIEQFVKLWSSLRPYYDAPTSNALLTRFYYDVTQTDADQRPRLLRLYYAAATTFKIILRRYADLEDCTTISLRRCRSYHACSTLLLRFWQCWIYIMGFKHYFSFISELQT